jgi:hypothetical protein
MLRAALAVFFLTLAAGCGPMPDLDKAGERLGVLTGGLDPTLVGTFRLWEKREPQVGMFTMLVLKTDLSFHGTFVASCAEQPCAGVIDLEGTYRQKRDLPDLTKASRVTLFAEYLHPETGVPTALYVVLRRGWVEGSPLIGLYHAQDGADDPSLPFFELSHPHENWCATP